MGDCVIGREVDNIWASTFEGASTSNRSDKRHLADNKISHFYEDLNLSSFVE